MGTAFQKERKYARHRALKGMLVAWKSAGKPMVSRAEALGMGGLFLHTSNPLPSGSVIELLLELTTGDVRARASVRDSVPGKGMGVQFVQMQTDDRSRLSQFLRRYAPAASELTNSSSCKMIEDQKAIPPEPKRLSQFRKRRSVRRCSLMAPAEIVDTRSGTRISARISKLAMGGCYVEALNPFAEGTRVKLRILRDQGAFETKAKVAYCHATTGMGLTFTELAPDQRSLLEEWLAEILTQRRST